MPFLLGLAKRPSPRHCQGDGERVEGEEVEGEGEGADQRVHPAGVPARH